MNQTPRPQKGRPTTRPNHLPAILSALVVVAIFVVLGFTLATNQPSSSQTGATADATVPVAESTPAAGEGTAVASASPIPAGAKPSYDARPEMTIDVDKQYTATITTPRGDIVINLRPDLAPETVNSFVFLAREGFYDGLTWHRVIPGFVAQGGDPLGDGTGGPGYTVPAEFTDKVLYDREGLVAMARAQDPDSGGSQFFITLAPAPNLNNQYTIFGEVVEGMDIVQGIPERDPALATTPGEQMLKITIEES